MSDEVTCQEFVDLVTDYFEGALARRTLGQVEEHLVMCDWCLTYMEQLQTTVELIADLAEPAPDPPASVLMALRARSGGSA